MCSSTNIWLIIFYLYLYSTFLLFSQILRFLLALKFHFWALIYFLVSLFPWVNAQSYKHQHDAKFLMAYILFINYLLLNMLFTYDDAQRPNSPKEKLFSLLVFFLANYKVGVTAEHDEATKKPFLRERSVSFLLKSRS